MHRLYVVPTLVINVAIIALPALLTIVLAFFRWDGISAPVFVGLGNFADLWGRPCVLDGADQQPDLDRDLSDPADRDGSSGGDDDAGGAAGIDVLSGGLFPACRDRDRDHGADLAGA